MLGDGGALKLTLKLGGLLATTFLPFSAQATNYTWQCPTGGDWVACWTTLPTSSDNGTFSSGSGTATLISVANNTQAGPITIGNLSFTNGITGNWTLNIQNNYNGISTDPYGLSIAGTLTNTSAHTLTINITSPNLDSELSESSTVDTASAALNTEYRGNSYGLQLIEHDWLNWGCEYQLK